MKLGFIGTGKMGSGMVRNLLRAGHEVRVYNRTRSKAEALTADGAQVAGSVADAATNADAVFSMLADDSAVEPIAQELASVLHISSSTISVALARRLAPGKAFISAPVFGRPEAAEAKKLIVVAAGDSETVARFRPVFDALGRQTFIAGTEPWQANAVKICGNFMIASMLETFSEAFTTLAKSGVERQAFLDVMNELWSSPVYRNYGQTIVDRRFDSGAGFGLRLGLKDVRLAVEFAQQTEAPMPFASVLRDHFLSAVANGQEQMDWSSIELVLARAAGLEH